MTVQSDRDELVALLKNIAGRDLGDAALPGNLMQRVEVFEPATNVELQEIDAELAAALGEARKVAALSGQALTDRANAFDRGTLNQLRLAYRRRGGGA